MTEWAEEPLGSLATFQKGRKVDTASERLPGFERYLGASGILGLPDGYASTTRAVKATESDVLMLWDGERSGLVGHGQTGVVASTVSRLSVRGPVDSEYLYYALAHQFEWIQNRRTGSGVPHVPKEIGRILRLRYPRDSDIQKRITAILKGLDAAISSIEALIEKHQQVNIGLMHGLFTRGRLPDGKFRPGPLEASERYRDTQLGKVPTDWEVSGLASRQRTGTKWIRTGPFGSSLKGEHWVTEGHPVITIGALGEGEFLSSELLYVGPRDASRLRDFQLGEGDVVFSRVADVGRSVVVRSENAGWIMSSNLMRIAVDPCRARPDFLQMALASDARIKAQIRAKVNSGGREVANSEVLSQLLFAWPPPDEQDRIVEVGLLAGSRIRSLQSTVQKLRAQKLGLMQDLLTGKVAVKLPEPAMPA